MGMVPTLHSHLAMSCVPRAREDIHTAQLCSLNPMVLRHRCRPLMCDFGRQVAVVLGIYEPAVSRQSFHLQAKVRTCLEYQLGPRPTFRRRCCVAAERRSEQELPQIRQGENATVRV